MIPEVGIHRGASFAEYFLWEALNHGTLEAFALPTRAHAREAILRKAEATVAQALGHAFHSFVLEPPAFATEYVVAPKVDRRTKLGKEAWAAFEAQNQDKTLLDADELRQYEGMRAALLEHPTARELLDGRGASEVSIVWCDAETGLLCKARVDRIASLAGWSFVVDLKTTKSAEERSFSKDVANYGYHRQLAWYRDGLETLMPLQGDGYRRGCIVAVEKERPFCVAVHELDERALAQGQREYRAHLAAFKECTETGSWPAFDGGMTLIDLPSWAVDQLD